ncbi:hypothetical protein [Coprobacter tertius]|uniref:Lipocalin-like domain-containing protein n=1 Tax=Coprobacter tertius TaxID=2944915 RepID=A0ABT1MJ64_9BACT|nr:hypothetical protein [Coprobacter tertius]MCP9612658.1 hypothetical protein [Coprobacter tertius]
MKKSFVKLFLFVVPIFLFTIISCNDNKNSNNGTEPPVFTDDNTPRIEGWKSNTVYMNAKTGDISSMEIGRDAAGNETGENLTRTYEFSNLNNNSDFFRASAKGDFSKQGSLSEGYIAIRESGGETDYLIAQKTTIEKTANGQIWLLFSFKDHDDIRIVTESL